MSKFKILLSLKISEKPLKHTFHVHGFGNYLIYFGTSTKGFFLLFVEIIKI